MPPPSSIPHVEGLPTYTSRHTTDRSPSLHPRTDRPKTTHPPTDGLDDVWQHAPQHHPSNVVPQRANFPPTIDPYNHHDQYNRHVSRLPTRKMCPKCGAPNPVNAKFRADCGVPFGQKTEGSLSCHRRPRGCKLVS